MISFLTRPVTRLPRLMLQLDFVLKHIVGDNPDTTTIPLICESLNTYIRSSQAGVEAADGKVKFWDLCENLLYQKGEIIVRPSLLTPRKFINPQSETGSRFLRRKPYACPCRPSGPTISGRSWLYVGRSARSFVR